MRTLKLLPSFLVVCLFAANTSAQQVGDRIVVTAENAQLRSQDTTTGTVPKGNILVVKNVNGDWFWVSWINSKAGTVQGWINHSDVIPFADALDFFNKGLKRNPTALGYVVRGMIWDDKGEYDIAIRDYNEAIRLDPRYGWAYRHRPWG